MKHAAAGSCEKISAPHTHPAAFTPSECKRIIRASKTADATDGTVAGTVADEIRSSRQRSMPRTQENIWLYRKLDTIASAANEANPSWRYQLADFEPVQLAQADSSS